MYSTCQMHYKNYNKITRAFVIVLSDYNTKTVVKQITLCDSQKLCRYRRCWFCTYLSRIQENLVVKNKLTYFVHITLYNKHQIWVLKVIYCFLNFLRNKKFDVLNNIVYLMTSHMLHGVDSSLWYLTQLFSAISQSHLKFLNTL